MKVGEKEVSSHRSVAADITLSDPDSDKDFGKRNPQVKVRRPNAISVIKDFCKIKTYIQIQKSLSSASHS